MENICYKYRPLYQRAANGEMEPHPFTESIFRDSKIYYANPASFNDPFDCNLKLHVIDSSEEEWRKYCDELVGSLPEYKEKIEEFKREKQWNRIQDIQSAIGAETLEINMKSSLLCLSKKGNSIPMFSYYSDSHRGIAIEFKFTDTEIPCGFDYNHKNQMGIGYNGKISFDDVQYSKRFPELNYHRLRGKKDLIKNIIYTKHHEWMHEAEFRIFRRGVPASNVKFNQRLLTRVIFGCKTRTEDMDLVRAWLADWPSDVIFSKAETAEDQFNLNIRDLEVVKNTGS